jgi:acetyl esterase/lipase
VIKFLTSGVGANWPAERIVVVGRSIGTGLAAWLAAQYSLGGCVLISPYTSMRGMVEAIAEAQGLPKGLAWVISNRLNSMEEVSQPGFPDLLIFHGTRDELIPFAHAEQLMAAADRSHWPALGGSKARILVPLDGYTHNDVFVEGTFDIIGGHFSKCFERFQRGRSEQLRIPPELFQPPVSSSDGQPAGTSLFSRMVAASGAISAQALEASASAATSGRF